MLTPRPTPAPSPTLSFNIPTIDISPFKDEPATALEAAESAQVVEQVRDACMTMGFFSLVGHGVARPLQERAMRAAERLFSLPASEKEKLVHPTQKNRGYEALGGQTLQPGAGPDLKEGFYLGPHIEADDPRVARHPRLMGPNLLPDSSVLAEDEFRRPVEEYYDAVLALSLTVFRILARGLPYGPDVFEPFVQGDPVCIMRLLHYPPAEEGEGNADPLRLGAGAHTDFGAITLLYTDSPGLQVLNPFHRRRRRRRSSGKAKREAVVGEQGEGEKEEEEEQEEDEEEWIPVPPNPDAYVVNIGDMLHAWTRGVYKSNVHRVLNLGGRHRYSIPFFFDGNADCPLAPFGLSKEEVDRMGFKVETASEHLLRRLDESYGSAVAPKNGGGN